MLKVMISAIVQAQSALGKSLHQTSHVSGLVREACDDWNIPRVFHLRNEAGQSQLPDECITHVHESCEPRHQSCALWGPNGHNGLAQALRIVSGRLSLRPSETSRQEYGDECEEG